MYFTLHRLSMSRYNLLFCTATILAALFVTVSCNSSKHSKSKRLPGIWQGEPIMVDGSNKDWPSPYPEYDDKAMLGYAVSNDKDNLYITVETGDLATQLKILRNGLTVWIDRKGDKDEVTAINFPIPGENTDEPSKKDRPSRCQWQSGAGSGQDHQRFELEDKVKLAMGDASEYSLQGFKSCNLQYHIMEKDSCGIVVRMAIDADNEMVWEAVVPFRTFYFKPEITRADKGRALSICFETTGSKRPAGQGSSTHNGGGGGMRPGIGMGMGGGMGMRMGGGGMHGGNRNAPNKNDMMESLYKSTKTYKKFGIAFQ